MLTDEVRARREKVVLDHFHDEVEQDWDAVLSTFPHPRYEIVPTQTVHDGDAAVRGYYHETRVAFPDQRHEMIALRHSDDAVIARLRAGLLRPALVPAPTPRRHRPEISEGPSDPGAGSPGLREALARAQKT